MPREPVTRHRSKRDPPTKPRANTRRKRRALAAAAAERVASNPSLDLDRLFPPGRRGLPSLWTEIEEHDLYVPFEELIEGLGINPADPKTRTSDPSVYHHLDDEPAYLQVMKQVIRPLWVRKGDLDISMIDRMLPPRLRSNEASDKAKTEKILRSIAAVKDETRSNLIAKKMKAIALAFISSPSFVAEDVDLNTFGSRLTFWRARVEECPSIVLWFWEVLKPTINLKFIYQPGQPETDEGRQAKKRMQTWLDAAFIYLLDWVYLYCMDMDLITPKGKDQWDEWDFLITAKWATLNEKPKLVRHALDLGKWPSYRTIYRSRVEYGKTEGALGSDE